MSIKLAETSKTHVDAFRFDFLFQIPSKIFSLSLWEIGASAVYILCEHAEVRKSSDIKSHIIFFIHYTN